jgi:hypothetical protein
MSVTYYVALPFVRTEDGVVAGEAMECQSGIEDYTSVDFRFRGAELWSGLLIFLRWERFWTGQWDFD